VRAENRPYTTASAPEPCSGAISQDILNKAIAANLRCLCSFIPGPGQAFAAARAAVQGAKSFAENGMDASKFFGDVGVPNRSRPAHNPRRLTLGVSVGRQSLRRPRLEF